jgi:two-component system, cell cycle sensor histidine kinase PleC
MVQDPPARIHPCPKASPDGASVTIEEPETVPSWSEATHMNPITLRFGDGALEARFLREGLRSAMPVVRLFLLSAVVLCALFGLLDPFAAPEAYLRFWIIRYGFIVTSLTVSLALTYTPIFVRHAQLIMSGGMLCSGGGILAMIAIADGPAKETYYAGLILVVIYGSSLVRLHHLNALLVATLLFLAYQLVALDINPLPLRTVFSNDFFFAVSILVGAFSSLFQELYIRRNFIGREMLVQGKARAERLQEQAEAANKAKGEFLGIISHELRTPLNAIIGFSDIMRQQMFGPLGADRYRTYADDIHNSGNHLLEIINTILDLTKADAGRLGLDEAEVDLVRTVESCLPLFRDETEQAQIRLRLIPPGLPLQLSADARLCRQIAINLLSNAVKFTPSGGAITVSFPSDDLGRRGLEIRDTGIGIAEQDLERVILPFVQVESSLSRNHGGTGLGLPLVKKIVELHDGTFLIDSRLNVGTVVTIWFPARRILDVAQPPTIKLAV